MLIDTCQELERFIPLLILKDFPDKQISFTVSESINKKEWDWDCLTPETFRTYVVSVACDMLTVYIYIYSILSPNEKDLIEWLLARTFSVDSNSIKEIIACNKSENVNKVLVDIKNESQSYETDIIVNSSYPDFLQDRKRLHNKFLQEVLCRKYIYQWFENKIEDVPYIKYVFFGCGKEPKEKLVFIGDKKKLVCFALFLNGGYGKSELWEYFNQYICGKKGKPVFAKNPQSNTKGTYPDYERNFRNIILAIIGKNELTKEEEEDIK